MAYKTRQELEEDMEDDPKLARMRIAAAKRAGKPVVSSSNRGYSNGNSNKKMDPAREAAIKKRMASSNSTNTDKPNKEDEMIAKRKKVGY